MATKTPKAKVRTYPHIESPLFGIRSKRRLAETLGWVGAPSALPKFSLRKENFSQYYDRSKPLKPRLIEAPQARLKAMQKRLETFLKRIEKPAYLHSGTPGRSYLSNSIAHCGPSGCTVTLDISEFFRSVTQDRVVRLFIRTFNCSRDVAETIAALVCCNAHLATGSPASPLLSWMAHREVFDEIAARADQAGATFTLYMDDIALTGCGIGHGDIQWITRVLKRSGLTVKREKTRLYRAGRPKLITGRAIANGKSRAPNQQHLKMKAAIDALNASPKDAGLRASAVGRLRHVAQLDESRRGKLSRKARDLAEQS